jgi:DNA sulfur modification protein DndB
MARHLLSLSGVVGLSAHRKVFMGFAPARVLHAISFADALDEDAHRGYQRRLNPQHSLDFRKYIQLPGSSTIPLTFNARPNTERAWRLVERESSARLEVRMDLGPVLAQVDCQHRIGHLADLDMPLPFMCYLGLTEREEMETFNIINSKAKGLSTSLLDYHAATLAANLAAERPELFIALYLTNDPESPWYRQLDLGGKATSGLNRRASLRTMQKAVKRFLKQSRILRSLTAEQTAGVVRAFWSAVASVLRDPWSQPRKHLLTKGVGVYALMSIAADLVSEASPRQCDKRYFAAQLPFLASVDWSNGGDFEGLGGETGVKQAAAHLRTVREKRRLKAVSRG